MSTIRARKLFELYMRRRRVLCIVLLLAALVFAAFSVRDLMAHEDSEIVEAEVTDRVERRTGSGYYVRYRTADGLFCASWVSVRDVGQRSVRERFTIRVTPDPPGCPKAALPNDPSPMIRFLVAMAAVIVAVSEVYIVWFRKRSFRRRHRAGGTDEGTADETAERHAKRIEAQRRLNDGRGDDRE